MRSSSWILLPPQAANTPLPDWAQEVLASYDAAFTLHAKRQMALESTIVLTKG